MVKEQEADDEWMYELLLEIDTIDSCLVGELRMSCKLSERNATEYMPVLLRAIIASAFCRLLMGRDR